MPISFEVDDHRAFAKLEGADDRVMDRFAELLKPIEEAMLDDARERAIAHFHSVGKKPGLYLAGFAGGVKKDHGSVVGFVRNGNNLAHLLESGFTISDWTIIPGTGANTTSHLGAIMAFAGDVGTVYRNAVRRHSTAVKAYPAIHPALEALAGQVRAAAAQAAGAD